MEQHSLLDSLEVSVEVRIPSDVRYIERVVEIVRHHCAEMLFGERQLTLHVPVALSEALSNAILRGNGDDPTKEVCVRALLSTRALVIEIRDEGQGFDVGECLRDPTRPENVEREDGRGLFLMHALMDRVERFDSGGNVVRLTLARDTGAA